MFVGDVRWATAATGCSCTLSGGSQWSSGPTWVSKNSQVRRARAPNVRRCSSVSGAGPRGASGRLTQTTNHGPASQSRRNGSAHGTPWGFPADTRMPTAAVAMTDGAALRTAARIVTSVPTSRVAPAAVVHSRSRRRLTTRRHRVRATASTARAPSIASPAANISSRATVARSP